MDNITWRKAQPKPTDRFFSSAEKFQKSPNVQFPADLHVELK